MLEAGEVPNPLEGIPSTSSGSNMDHFNGLSSLRNVRVAQNFNLDERRMENGNSIEVLRGVRVW